MSGKNRLMRELNELQKSNSEIIRDLDASDSNSLFWKCLILPQSDPYKVGAFKIEINFPVEYPFKPPEIRFITAIYHINIDDKGRVCLPMINSENWKPVYKMDDVFTALVKLIDEPEPDHPLRSDLAEEYVRDRSKYNENAEQFTKDYAEKR